MKLNSTRCEAGKLVFDGMVLDAQNGVPVNFLRCSRLRAFAAALMLLAAGSLAYAQQNRSQRIPPFVYGTWTINRFVEVGGHSPRTKEQANAQIGKTLKIRVRTFDHDNDMLWFGNDPCKSVNYRMKVNKEGEYDVGDKGTLGFNGLEPASNDYDEFLVVSCSKREMYFLEFAKNQELAVYYDGYFFFLRKTKGAPD